MEFHLVQNRKENCHYDHIPFNVKGNGNIVFLVYWLNLWRCILYNNEINKIIYSRHHEYPHEIHLFQRETPSRRFPLKKLKETYHQKVTPMENSHIQKNLPHGKMSTVWNIHQCSCNGNYSPKFEHPLKSYLTGISPSFRRDTTNV